VLRSLWDQIAFIARYAHQPLPVILGMTPAQGGEMIRALNGIVERENGNG